MNQYLVDAICSVYDRKDLRPADGKTWCNVAVHLVAKQLGYVGFDGLLANQIIEKMEVSHEWSNLVMADAQGEANLGRLVIAGEKEEPHGHVVVIRPGVPVSSGKWGRSVPKCMNIGQTVFIDKGVNWAFTEIPRFWVRRIG